MAATCERLGLMPWRAFERSNLTLSFKLTVKAARSLMAADKGGTSDAYVVLKALDGKVDYKSQTVRKTVNPVWQEEVMVSETVRALEASPLKFTIWDDDEHSKDDEIGIAILQTASISALIDKAIAGDFPPDGIELWLDVAPQGYLGIVITLEAGAGGAPVMAAPSAAEILSYMAAPIVGPIVSLVSLPSRLPTLYATAKVKVTLKSASKLLASDGVRFGIGRKAKSLGSSDPYVEISMGGSSFKSSTKQNTTNPVWGEAFEVSGFVHELQTLPVEFTVYDDDSGGPLSAIAKDADDDLGFTDLPASQIAKLLAFPPDGVGKDFALTLTTQGALAVNVQLSDLYKPPWPEAATLFGRRWGKPLLEMGSFLQVLPQRWEEMRRLYSSYTISITLLSASDLIASDISLSGLFSPRGKKGSGGGLGTSDPYVALELAGEAFESTTKQNTLEPTWNEAFVFTKRVMELEADEDGFLTLEVFDDDLIDADDSLGVTGLCLKDLLELSGKGPTRKALPLSTKGVVRLAPFLPSLGLTLPTIPCR